ncbi:MAG TPA: phenylalanine 4-monooxygenase [Acidimicrobiales bacterium]|jgi:phenylalanine-4-hydroxylase|nr:phenylalanine 4-monooxygenase [Acidimicrobiales bacterium]
MDRYSPVRTTTGGRVTVELAGDHPGVTDPVYRARRDDLAGLAARWSMGQPVPEPEYSDVEHGVWAEVSAALVDLHERHACTAYLEGKDAVRLPADRVPQLTEVGERLSEVCGFRYLPVAGLAPLRDFYGSFAEGVFWSTQYLRHPSVPLYTPEPDVIHEVIGHANQLGAPGYADMYRLVGEAVARTRTDEALRFLSHVFWYTMEFGVVRESGRLKAFGAGILSSVGETAEFGQVEVRPADFWAMGSAEYDITRFQPVLYSWESPAALEDGLSSFLVAYDDSTPATLRRAG